MGFRGWETKREEVSYPGAGSARDQRRATSDKLLASASEQGHARGTRLRRVLVQGGRSERVARATPNRLLASASEQGHARGTRLRRVPLAVSSRGLGRSPLKA